MKNTLLILVSVMFGYMMVPEIASAAKKCAQSYYTVPNGVRKITITSTYRGKVVLNHTLSVRPKQRFVVKSAN